jgi:hypothetical protein
MDAVIATGAPKPAMPSMSAPKQNAGQPGERAADDVEIAARHGEVVEEHRADHDPADRPQTERHPVRRGGNGQRQRHAPHEPSQHERRRRRRHCGAPWRYAEDSQQQREKERGHRGDKRREENAAADGVVNLVEDFGHGPALSAEVHHDDQPSPMQI